MNLMEEARVVVEEEDGRGQEGVVVQLGAMATLVEGMVMLAEEEEEDQTVEQGVEPDMDM